MLTDAKHILRIFVSHKDVNECPSLADAYKVIQEEADKINRSGLQRHLIEIQPQDYQIGRDLSNPQRGTFQSADSLKNDAYRAHAVFTLVDGDISPRIRDWYKQQIKKVQKEAKDRQIPMPIFWDTSSAESKANCEAFHRGNDSDYILKFNSLEEFRRIVAKQLEQLSGRWAAMINGGQAVPTLESNSLRRKKRWFISSIVFLAIAIAVYMLSPYIPDLFRHSKEGGDTPVVPIQEDKARESFKARLLNAESLVARKLYTPARDTLKLLRSICRPEWGEEKVTIDSLWRVLPSIPPPPPPLPPDSTIIEENTFEIVGAQSPLRGYLSNSIKEAIPGISKPSGGRKERWTITIEQDLSAIEVPKIIESDEYMIDIEYGFSVKDNQAEKTVFENTLSTRGRSPASLEDAKKHSRQIAAQEIAQQVKQFIQ